MYFRNVVALFTPGGFRAYGRRNLFNIEQIMKALPVKITAAVFLALLCGCDRTAWIERRIPTTDAERKMVKEHVEAIIPDILPETLSGDDQDLEDIVIEAHTEARNSFCRPTLWEWKNDEYTGRWKYSEEIK